MDLWVEKSEENYIKIKNAFLDFGMSMFDMSKENFQSNTLDVFSFGKSPVRIDILTALKGLNFVESFKIAEFHQIDEIPVRVIHYNHLIESKKAAAENKDLDDVEQLEGKQE